VVEVFFFVSGIETPQILGVEMSIGGSPESFEDFPTIYSSIITQDINLIIKLSKV
jgi:hypothetical protein